MRLHVPLSLMPAEADCAAGASHLSVRVAAAILPFRWMIGFPVELRLGRLTPARSIDGAGSPGRMSGRKPCIITSAGKKKISSKSREVGV